MTVTSAYASLFNISEDEVKYLYKNRTEDILICKCGKFRKLKPSSQSKIGKMLAITCGNPKCNPACGRKRPEHSTFIKKLIADGTNEKFMSTIMKKGERFNKEVNTPEFKRKVLERMGIVVTDVEVQFSKMMSNRNKDVNQRRKQIINRYTKWESEYRDLIELVCGVVPTLDWVYSLSESDIHMYWGRIHGINTIRNSMRSQNSGRTNWFKTDTICGLQYNTQGLTAIRTRSGLETDFIQFFEKYKIKWSYEELRILTLDGSGFYVPDFIIDVNGQKYIIEAKGSFYRQDKEVYIKNKIGAGVKFASERGWKFCLVYQSPKNFKFLTECIIGE